MPYTERRERLAELGLDDDPVRTPPWYPGGAADVLAASLANALEGVVGKPLASGYHPGQRRDWIKIKNIRYAEVIICGWKPGQGRRADTIGSLLVGSGLSTRGPAARGPRCAGPVPRSGWFG